MLDSHYCGKDICYEPQTEKEMFEVISAILDDGESEEMIARRIANSKIYFHAFYSVISQDFGLFGGAESDFAEPGLKFSGLKDIKPGANEQLDYICDSILNQLAIYDEDRWPPLN